MKPEGRYGSWSLASATAVVMLVHAFEPTLQLAIRAGQTGAWLSLLLAGLFAMLFFWPVAAAVARLPRGSNLISLARIAAGEPGAIATSLLVAGLIVFSNGSILRQTAEMVVTSDFPHTPQTFSMVALGGCALMGAWGEMDGIIRLNRAYLPFLVGGILVLLLGSISWGERKYLLPVWGPGPWPLLAGAPRLSALHALGPLCALIAADKLIDRRRLFLTNVVAIGLVSLLLAATAAVFLAVYPLPLAPVLTFPSHLLARLVAGGRFFERVEGIWMLFWFFAIAARFALLTHAAALSIQHAFGTPWRLTTLPLAVLIAVAALFPTDQGQVQANHERAVPVIWLIGYGLPLLIALAAFLRQKWSRHAA